MKRNVYDVYDLNGNKLIEEKTASEISIALCVPAYRVTKCCCEHRILEGKYCIVKSYENETSENNSSKSLIIDEWEKVTAPFRNVEWVKRLAPGVKILAVKEV